nr:[Fe-Fe] hydrogenase large subunit C-terminal domain-containing protein [Maliibacterium massiliense]
MNAIQSMKANCRNCYKCLRVCPVKSIRFNDSQAEIMPMECIWCGACVSACPQNAKVINRQLDKVKTMLRMGEKVVFSVAPSFLGAFDVDDPMRVVGAFKRLGIYQVRETAQGAAVISDALVDIAKERGMDNIITTCCPAATDLVEKHYPQIVDALSPLVSPMIAHARLIKQELGEDVRVVFVGPCIAKMEEAKDVRNMGSVDAVLTFQDMIKWLAEKEIDAAQAQPMPFDGVEAGLARMYPSSAGIVENVLKRGMTGYRMLHVDGIDACRDVLEAVRQGKLHNCFIEMSVCNGSCMGGPGMPEAGCNRFESALRVEAYAQDAAVDPVPDIACAVPLAKVYTDRSSEQDQPSEEEIRAILRSIGKETEDDELNCGSCGYPTCRAKAIAVYQHKAEVSMCMPYMYQMAQSMSNVVMDNTPNLILVADNNLKICEMNQAALHTFNLTRAQAMEKYVYELMDTGDYEFVLESGENIVDKVVQFEELGMTLRQTLVHLDNNRGVMGIFWDITQEEERQKALYQLRVDTMDMAQKVIDKQMVAAQEIASLLGETTAETKATLTHLKNMIIGDDGDGRL